MIKGPKNDKPARTLGTEPCCIECEYALICLTNRMRASRCAHCGQVFQLWSFTGAEETRLIINPPAHCKAYDKVKYTTGICAACYDEGGLKAFRDSADTGAAHD